MLAQTVIVAIGAIGMTLIIISGGIDLSVGSAIALTGVITALGLNAGLPPSTAVAAGILVGGLVGLVNSDYHTSPSCALHRNPGNVGSCAMGQPSGFPASRR